MGVIRAFVMTLEAYPGIQWDMTNHAFLNVVLIICLRVICSQQSNLPSELYDSLTHILLFRVNVAIMPVSITSKWLSHWITAQFITPLVSSGNCYAHALTADV